MNHREVIFEGSLEEEHHAYGPVTETYTLPSKIEMRNLILHHSQTHGAEMDSTGRHQHKPHQRIMETSENTPQDLAYIVCGLLPSNIVL